MLNSAVYIGIWRHAVVEVDPGLPGWASEGVHPIFDLAHEALYSQHCSDLETSGWSKEPPAPELPPEVVQGTLDRYREAYRQLTGTEIEIPATATAGSAGQPAE